MIILGLDPGLANTGWGVIETQRGRFKALAHGSITTSPKQETGERLNIIFNEIQKVIDRFSPQYAGIESLFFAKNQSSAMPVAQAKGILHLLMYQNNIQPAEFTPIQIKQSVTGSGKASKSEVQQLVKILLGMQQIPKPDHAADALAAAITFEMNKELIIGRLHV